MTNHAAWLYAASWGSFVRGGDPGACMYGFSEDFRVQSKSHRQDCLDWMAINQQLVAANPEDYESEELIHIDAFVAKLKTAEVAA